MKVAVSSTGDNIDAPLNPRFGRCDYFIIVDTEDMSFEAYKNENAELSSGAGIQAASFVVDKGATAIVTGNCGPKAAQVFSAADIKVLTGYSGTVRDAVAQFAAGDKKQPTAVSSPSPTMAPEASCPQPGAGMGRGMGGGGRCRGGAGRGLGMGIRRLSDNLETPSTPQLPDDLTALKAQARDLKEQMEEIEKKINALK